mmetsp:Transcript_3085/g.6712  ORF Transcript_3085/g.6712 Transcript_3085/m.6712 type:complete len:122 (+) Transcript_3085:209-574(+)
MLMPAQGVKLQRPLSLHASGSAQAHRVAAHTARRRTRGVDTSQRKRYPVLGLCHMQNSRTSSNGTSTPNTHTIKSNQPCPDQQDLQPLQDQQDRGWCSLDQAGQAHWLAVVPPPRGAPLLG